MNSIESGKLMPEMRAQEIALAILRHEATKQEFLLSPMEDRWAKRARRWNMDPDELRAFLLKVRLPVSTKEAFNMEIEVTCKGKPLLTPEQELKIALKILQGRGVDLRVDEFDQRIHDLRRAIGISMQDIWDFFLQHIVPAAITNLSSLVGGPPLSINISDEPKPASEIEREPNTPGSRSRQL